MRLQECYQGVVMGFTLLLTPSAPTNSLGRSTWPLDKVAVPFPASHGAVDTGHLYCYNVQIATAYTCIQALPIQEEENAQMQSCRSLHGMAKR